MPHPASPGVDSAHPSAILTDGSNHRQKAPAATQLALPFLAETPSVRSGSSIDGRATGRHIADGDGPASRATDDTPAGTSRANVSANGLATGSRASASASGIEATPSDASARAQHWDMYPRALAEGQRVRVVSLAAGRLGVRAGMAVPEARASCAALDVRPWDDGAIADAILAVTTALLAASPQVTPVAGAPGMWWVGATGFERMGGDEALGQALLAIARVWHPDARVAIADSCVAARAATWAPAPRSRAVRERDPRTEFRTGSRAPDGLTCIPIGGCAQYLAPAPLGLVPMEDELRSGLQALGLRTVGALAALEAGDVERRWGADGLGAWRLAHGDDPRRPGLVRVEAARSASVELPGPAESTEPVLFVLRALLERLVRELVQDARAAASVAVTLVLDAGRQWPLDEDAGDGPLGDGPLLSALPPEPVPATAHGPHVPRPSSLASRAPSPLTPASLLAVPHRTITREARPARPLARLEPLFDQCRALLERWSIPAPVIGVTVSIPATAPLAADQGDLLIPSWRDAAMNADAVFTRLRAALDPDGAHHVVVHPVAGDTHRPEEAARWEHADAMLLGAATTTVSPAATGAGMGEKTADATTPESRAGTSLPALPAVLRMLETPEAVEIEEADGLPDAVWWRGRRLSFASIDGPERLSGDWWRPDAYARDYWRAMVNGEGELLLYREAANGAPSWYVQGWYD